MNRAAAGRIAWPRRHPYNVRALRRGMASSGVSSGASAASVGPTLRWKIALRRAAGQSKMMALPYRVLVIQTLAAGLIGAVLLLSSLADAVAALLAGIVVVIPNAYFAWRVVTLDVGGDPEQTSRRLVFQGVQKQLLMLALMVAMFVWVAPAPWPFFGALIVLMAIHGLASVLAGPPRSRAR